MKNKNSHTAIILFARTVEMEMQNKHFTHSKQRNTEKRLATLLLRHTLEEIKKTELPYFHFSEQNQRGNTFGEKLANAFNEVFISGYDHVITIGADCPELKARDLLKAKDSLMDHDAVLGPSRDGGLYLIALKRKAFSLQGFKRIKWCSGKDLDELQTFIGQEVFILKAKSDVDNPETLNHLVKYRFIPKTLYNKIVKLLDFGRLFATPIQVNYSDSALYAIPSRRGPPCF